MIQKIVVRVFGDRMFRNSLYLMISTAIMAGLGFFFWLINAHLFSEVEIGHATTLISAMTTISILSLIGFDSVLVRFLPGEDSPSDKMNTGIILVGSVALIASCIFMFFIDILAPELQFFGHRPLYAFLFVFATVMAAINMLTDSVFIAYLKTNYTLTVNTIFSTIKTLLPFFFIHYGAVGIFTAAAISQTVGTLLSIWVMTTRLGYRPSLTVSIATIRRVWKYSAGNYAAGIISLTPSALLPIMVLNHLGAENAAYYYIAMMIAGLLYTIPGSAARSLFAESSNDEAGHRLHVKKTAYFCATLLVPAILVLLLGSDLILMIFGKSYSAGGNHLLQLLAISGVSYAAYSIFTSIFRFNHDILSLILTNTVDVIGVIGIGYLLIPYGLVGIGFAWLLGSTGAGLFGYLLYKVRGST